MPIQSWESVLNTPGEGAGVALANSVALTDISPAPQFVLPGNYSYVGQKIRLRAWGTFSTTGTPTLLLGFYYGGVAGVAFAATNAITTASGVTNVPWRIEYDGEVRSIGTAGTIAGQGLCFLGTAVGVFATPTPIPITAFAVVSIDTTANKPITVGAQWGTASASNTVTCQEFIIESLN